MFNTGIYPSGDSQLDTYVQDHFIAMIEMAGLDYLRSSWGKKEPLDEYLDTVFPRAFLRRNPKKAVEIMYDLDDIARSTVIRQELPPLHLYAMYWIIRDYEELKDDIGDTNYDLEMKNYIYDNYEEDEADWLCSFFENTSENFVAWYDDKYIWLDLWEHRFLWYINNPKEFPLLTPDVEHMLQLMPNDIVDQWSLRKMEAKSMLPIYREYDFFVSHATEDRNAIAEPLTIELEKLGAKVWLDKFEMKIGDSLRASIDYGIAHSKHGIIILSKHYMCNFWTELEMNALFTKLSIGSKNNRIILPLWHNVTKQEVAQYSPMMADFFALSTKEHSITELAKQLMDVL